MFNDFDSKKFSASLSAINRDMRASSDADIAENIRFHETHSRDSKNLDVITEQFKKLNEDLARERIEREKGDKINFTFNIITGIFSLLSLGVSIVSLVMQLLGR
jgi:hypothetical protein